MPAMQPGYQRVGAALRVVVLAALALGMLPGRLISDPPVPELVAPAQPASAVDKRQWSLRAGGWVIRVDGAEVAIPTVAQQTQPIARIREPAPLSPYDVLIAHHAQAEGLDWRLVAALIFEESRFVPDAVSDKGAYGLMQVMPIAAAAVGALQFHAPSDNIRTGARYLKQLSDTFTESRGRDHLALVLAAYNMGPGHLRDAQLLARHFGYDPARWRDSMELVLPLLEAPQFQAELPNGFADGSLTVAYVNRILDRYDGYRRQFGSQPLDRADEPAEYSTESTPAG